MRMCITALCTGLVLIECNFNTIFKYCLKLIKNLWKLVIVIARPFSISSIKDDSLQHYKNEPVKLIVIPITRIKSIFTSNT